MTDEIEEMEEALISELVPEAAVVSLNVDGETIEVAQDEVLEAGKRALQKESSGEAKLELAAQREADLNDREAELKELELNLRRDSEDTVTDLGKDFAEAIFEDEEKVAKVISNFDARLNRFEQSEKVISQKLASSEEAEKKRLIGYYHGKYKDIASNRDMHAVFSSRMSTIAKSNPEISPIVAIDQAASAVMDLFGETIKDRMPRQPTTLSKRALSKKEEIIQSDADIIAEMKAGRAGQS